MHTIDMKKIILVATDAVPLGEPLLTLLSLSGYHVVCAHTGKAAVMLAQEFQPDAAVIDETLPMGTRDELIRRLKAPNPSIPVVFATSLGTFALILATLRVLIGNERESARGHYALPTMDYAGNFGPQAD